eukprot:6049653-Pleurochrysis_carterae.AAC.1
MKLFKASRTTKGEVAAMLLPPTYATHRTRSDSTDALELTFNMGIISKLSLSACHVPQCTLLAPHYSSSIDVDML